jgi:4-oxalocrotonate tautomerase
MPYVIVKLCPRKTEKQKQELADNITRDVCRIFNYGEESVSVEFEEVASEDWTEKVYKSDTQAKQKNLYKKPDTTFLFFFQLSLILI